MASGKHLMWKQDQHSVEGEKRKMKMSVTNLLAIWIRVYNKNENKRVLSC